MGARADALADEFARVNAEFIAVVERCSPEDWRAECPNEGRTVGVVAYHAAGAHGYIARWAQATAAGQGESFPAPSSAAAMDERNAQQAEQYADCSKEEVLDLLRINGAEAEGIVRAIPDDHLDRTASFALFGGRPWSAQQIIEHGLIAHPKGHLESIRAVARV